MAPFDKMQNLSQSLKQILNGEDAMEGKKETAGDYYEKKAEQRTIVWAAIKALRALPHQTANIKETIRVLEKELEVVSYVGD